MPYPQEQFLPVIDVLYPRYVGWTLPSGNSLYLDPAQETRTGATARPYENGRIYGAFTNPKYYSILDLYGNNKFVGGNIGVYVSNVNEIYSCGTGLCSRLEAANVPRSLFHAQYDLLNQRNSYPRVTNVNNPQSATGSTSLNPLSSVKDYYSDYGVIFFDYLGYGFGGFPAAKVSKLKIVGPNSPMIRKKKIKTYSPYVAAAEIDFTNYTSYLKSFTY